MIYISTIQCIYNYGCRLWKKQYFHILRHSGSFCYHLVWPILFQDTMVEWSPLGDGSACSALHLDPHSSHIFYRIDLYYWQIFCEMCKLWSCCSVQHKHHLLHVCPYAALLEDPSIFFSPFYRILRFFLSQYGKFFLTWIDSLRTAGIVHCTYFKAHWWNVIVILGNIYNIDLIWLFWQILRLQHNSQFCIMIFIVSGTKKQQQFKSCRCDICWGQHQTNMFSSICRMRFVGQEIFGAPQYFIIMLFCHTVYQDVIRIFHLAMMQLSCPTYNHVWEENNDLA